MKVRIGEINYVMGIMYAVLAFLVIPMRMEHLIYIHMVAMIAINILFIFLSHEFHPPIEMKVTVIMIIYSFAVVITSDYSQTHVLRGWITLLIICLIDYNGIERISRIGTIIIWLLCFSLIIYRLIVSPRMWEGSPIFETAFYDRIETELCILLFAFFAYKQRIYSGLVLLIFYLFTTSTSRGTMLMFVLFLFVVFTKNTAFFSKAYDGVVTYFSKPKKLFAVQILAVGAFIAFCYFWVFYVSVLHHDAYHESLFDTSNLARFGSTVFSIDELFRKYNLWFSGLGSDIMDVMGISGDNYRHYLGTKLVQSHNSIINGLLSFGIIPGIVYFACLSEIIRKYFKYENIEYILNILIYSFIIVIFNKKGLELFWILILMIPPFENSDGIDEMSGYEIR